MKRKIKLFDLFMGKMKMTKRKTVVLSTIFTLFLITPHAFSSSVDFSKMEIGNVVKLIFQQQTVTGTVLDEKGIPLPGVTVQVKNTNVGAITDFDGEFSIEATDDDILIFSFLGFKTTEILVDGNVNMDVTLMGDLGQLDEVVVIGYGAVKRKDLTGAVSTVSGEAIENQAVPNVAQALQGKVAGLNIRQTSGAPGAGAEISIRGMGSFGANSSPLVVIDGIITSGGLSNIDPNSIGNVTVLKDATSAAIYGSRGANGVVLITTKKGRAGKEVINFDAYYSMDNVINQIETVDAATYAGMVNDFYVNDGKEAPYADPASQGVGTNWQDEIFRTGSRQNYSLSMTGGAEKNSHALVVSYYEGKGVVVNSKYNRGNFRINNDIKPLKGLSIGSGVALSYATTKEGNPGEAIARALIYAPNVKPYNEDGSYGIADRQGQPTTMTQPLVAAYERHNEVINMRLLGNLFAEYEIVTGLKFRTSLGLEYMQNDGTNFTPSYNFGLGNANGIATLNRNNNNTKNYIIDNIFTYNHLFNQIHDVNMMAGYTFQYERYEYLNAYRNTFSRNDDYLRVLDAGTSNDQARGSYTEWAVQSFLGRLNYAYDSKYLFSTSLRIDESSRFHKDNRRGVFPAFSAGWVLSNEDFLRNNLGSMSYLKLRAGYGILGNQDIGIYPYQAALNSNLGYTFGTSESIVPGASPTAGSNRDITWEKTTTIGAGLEANFFMDKLGVIVDYYDRRTTDVLVRVPLPFVSGLATFPYQNVGSVRNNGYEFTVDYRNTSENRDFSYNIGLNLTLNNNEVTELDSGLDIIQAGGGQGGTSTRTTEGQAINTFYGYVQEGVFQTAEEIQNAPTQTNAAPGDIRFSDLNNDGVIDDNDRTFIGNFMADKMFGFNANMKYKNFDFAIAINGDFGRHQTIFAPGFAAARAAESTNIMWADRWTGSGTSNFVPRIVGGDPNNNSRSSDFWVRKQDFIRIQNVQLGYDLSNRVERTGLNKLRVYVAAQNLATFTDWPGYDPETTANAYPLSRSVFVGLNLGL
jgi:TonB-linked SusC/RagA family outer membrane protein